MMHETRDGTQIPIAEMSNKHLLNTIKLHERRAKEGIETYYCVGTCGEDFDCDYETAYGKEALKILKHKYYIREAKKRGLIV